MLATTILVLLFAFGVVVRANYRHNIFILKRAISPWSSSITMMFLFGGGRNISPNEHIQPQREQFRAYLKPGEHLTEEQLSLVMRCSRHFWIRSLGWMFILSPVIGLSARAISVIFYGAV